MKKTILITGATAGIGKATAEKFASENYRLILTGRRENRLKELAENLRKAFGNEILTLAFDVRDKEATQEALENLPGEWKDIDILINNAGLAVGLSHVQDGDIDDWERMIDTNIKGLLYVSRFVAPGMKKRKSGHIINLGSIAGKEVYENGNVYCATKHAVDALSRAMRIDLLHDRVKVTNIAPGLVETEFSLVRFKGDSEKAEKPYRGLEPLTGEDIADVIYYVASTPEHVNINDIVVMPTAQASANHYNRG